MTDSVRLGRILGIPVGASWSILAVAALFTATLALQSFPLYAPEAELAPRAVAAVVAVIGLFASILAHEVGHAVVAMNHGVGVWGISLWLLGGVAKLDRQAPNPRAEARIAAAGPLVSLLAGAFFGSVAVVAEALGAGRLSMAVLVWLAGVNILLALFNLVPAAPLDGGRVLAALLWRSSGDAERARVLAGRAGLGLGATMVVTGAVQLVGFGQLSGGITFLIGAFVLTAAREEIATAVIRSRLAPLVAADVMASHPEPVPDTVTLHQLDLWLTGPSAAVAHPVVRWGSEPIGYLVPEAHRDIPSTARAWTQVHQVMRRPDTVHHVALDDPMPDLLDRWNGTGRQILVVHDEHGRAVGTISDRQIQPLLTPPDLLGRGRSITDPPPPAPPAPPLATEVVGALVPTAAPTGPPPMPGR
jgi:Zn-dependent protease